MKKLAIFVEGYTELLFLDKLIAEILGAHNVEIQHSKIIGGSSVPKKFLSIKAATKDHDKEFFVLIYDCNGDRQVATRIREEHANLDKSGYSKIIGIRDVKPEFTFEEVPRLEAGLKMYIKTKLIPVEYILAVMEIESWFLSEYKHFSKISADINPETILANLGFCPITQDMERREDPYLDMQNCYQIGGKTYTKGTVETPHSLDYEHLYLEVSNKIANLGKLTSLLDDFATA